MNVVDSSAWLDLRTPLQIQMQLNLALEASYQSGERHVSVEVFDRCSLARSGLSARSACG